VLRGRKEGGRRVLSRGRPLLDRKDSQAGEIIKGKLCTSQGRERTACIVPRADSASDGER
jgi:hypothetical protein